MKGRIIFLLEEPSMKELLEGLLPRILPGLQPGRHFLCVPHQGRSDLELSIPRKLRAWREPGVRFVVVEDNDSRNCLEIKRRLSGVCGQAGRPDTLVRLACQELEAWYLGDPAAMAAAFQAPSLDSPGVKHRIGDPDRQQKPSKEVERLWPAFEKRSGARAMALHLDPARNTSKSFRVFAEGVTRVAVEMGYQVA